MELTNLFQQRLEQLEATGAKEYLKSKGVERNKAYNDAVKCFQVRVNKDRKKAKQTDLPFMAIKMKLAGVREVDDLRMFYKQCLDYSYTKDKQGRRNSFSKAFMGALKIR